MNTSTKIKSMQIQAEDLVSEIRGSRLSTEESMKIRFQIDTLITQLNLAKAHTFEAEDEILNG